MSALLLDTCAVIYFAHGEPIKPAAKQALHRALIGEGAYVSPISAWEIGLLSRPGSRSSLRFLPDPTSWFRAVLSRPGVREAPFTPEIAIDSSHLPPPLHADPADRLIIATARRLDMPIMTNDRAMLAYASTRNVRVIGC